MKTTFDSRILQTEEHLIAEVRKKFSVNQHIIGTVEWKVITFESIKDNSELEINESLERIKKEVSDYIEKNTPKYKKVYTFSDMTKTWEVESFEE